MPEIVLTLQGKTAAVPLGRDGRGFQGACELRLDLSPGFHLRELDGTGLALRVVSCRRVRDGGRFDGSEEERAALLRPFLGRAGGPFVDVEWDGPLREWTREFPEQPFILSYHNTQWTPPDLESIWTDMRRWPARRFKIVTAAGSWRDVIGMKALLADARSRRLDLTAYCLGPFGHASRLLGLVWGGGMMYVSQGAPPVPGMLSLYEFEEVYRAGRAGAGSRVYGVAGDPVERSLSPLLHNWFFARKGTTDIYLPLPAPDPEDFRAALAEIAPAGLSVTVPHKERWLAACAELTADARRIGAVNTLTATPDGWEGDNTDWLGFERSLEGWLPTGRGRFLVLGAGGTARAVLHALERRGARVACWNRNKDRLAGLLREFPAVQPADIPRGEVDVVVNATAASAAGELPLPETGLASLQAGYALEVAYGPVLSPFLRFAAGRGWRVRDGLPMLFHQAAAQHYRWTGADPAADWGEARALVESHWRRLSREGSGRTGSSESENR